MVRIAGRICRGVRLLVGHGPLALMRRVRYGPAQPADPAPPATGDPGLGAQYQEWLRRQVPDLTELELMRGRSAGWGHRPLVSVIMPVYDTPPAVLAEAIASVTRQTYPNWELCIADGASTDPEVRRVLHDAAGADPRVRVLHCPENHGIAATSNAALQLATGELVTFLDPDGALRRHALHRVVELLQERRDAGVVYSDEDRLLLSGDLGEPFFKPAWSPDLLLSTNYLRHMTVVRRALVEAAGGFRAGFDGSQDHDLLLRVTELAEERGLAVVHLPDMLYIGRQPPGPAARSAGSTPHTDTAGRRAVEEALRRRGLEGTVCEGAAPGWYHVRYALRGRPSIAVVIPTRDRVELLRACVESIESRTTYGEYTLVIVDNDSREPETLQYLDATPHRVIRDPRPFNYPQMMNAAIALLDAEHVVLLNNDVTVITPDWLEAMLEHSQRPEVGAVGCRLLFPDGRPQHEGVAVGVGSPPAINLDLSMLPPMGLAIREVTAVTAACMMIRRALYAEMGGMVECLRVAWNDVDLCLRLRREGYRNIYTPLAQLYHHESATRGSLTHEEDDIRFATLWGNDRRLPPDAHVNPHLEWVSPVRLRHPGPVGPGPSSAG